MTSPMATRWLRSLLTRCGGMVAGNDHLERPLHPLCNFILALSRSAPSPHLLFWSKGACIFRTT